MFLVEVKKHRHYIKNYKCFPFPAVLQENHHPSPKDSAISKSFSAKFPILFLSICQAPLPFPFSCSCCSWRSQPACVYMNKTAEVMRPQTCWGMGREHQEDVRIQLPLISSSSSWISARPALLSFSCFGNQDVWAPHFTGLIMCRLSGIKP